MPLPGSPPLAVAYFILGVFVNGPKTLSGIALRQVSEYRPIPSPPPPPPPHSNHLFLTHPPTLSIQTTRSPFYGWHRHGCTRVASSSSSTHPPTHPRALSTARPSFNGRYRHGCTRVGGSSRGFLGGRTCWFRGGALGVGGDKAFVGGLSPSFCGAFVSAGVACQGR